MPPPPEADAPPVTVSADELAADAAALSATSAASPALHALAESFLQAAVPAPGQALVIGGVRPFRREPPAAVATDGATDADGGSALPGSAAAPVPAFLARLLSVPAPAAAAPLATGAAGSSLPPQAWELGAAPDSAEARAHIAAFAAPTLFALLPVDQVLLVLGALLAETSVVVVGGALGAECVTSCVLALGALLAPLSWASNFATILPLEQRAVMAAPNPLLVGALALADDFEADEKAKTSVVVLLDREVVRFPRGHRDGEEGAPQLLEMLLPSGSALAHALAPLAAPFAEFRESRTGGVDGGGGDGLSAAAVQAPNRAQVGAAVALVGAINAHVRRLAIEGLAAGLSSPRQRVLAPPARCAERLLERAPEATQPFWKRFLLSQLFMQFHERVAARAIALFADEGVSSDEEEDS